MTAPPGFGKTTILSMIKTFLEIEVDESGAVIDRTTSKNCRLFQKHQLMITNHAALICHHFAKYPVLNISFKNLTGFYSVEEFLKKLNAVLDDVLKLHSYLNDSDKLNASQKHILRIIRKMVDIGTSSGDEIAEAFAFLKQCLFEHFGKKKVFVFIDDCDTPIFNSRHNIKTIDIDEDILEIIYKILSTLLDDDEETLKGYFIAGIYQVDYQKFIPEPSSTTTFRKICFQDRVINLPYFGLLGAQVNAILRKRNIDNETIKKIKIFYDGYYNKSGIKVYSPWSILSCLQFKQLKSCWLKSSRVDSGVEHIEVLYALERLMRNIPYELKYKKLIANLDYKNDDFLDYLIHLGYLSYKTIERGNILLTAPREDIRSRISSEEIEVFRHSNINIVKCAKYISEIRGGAENTFYREFMTALRDAFNGYDIDLIKTHNEFFYLILFISAIKVKWFTDVAFSLLRPSFDSILLRSNSVAILMLMTCNNDGPSIALERIMNIENVNNYFRNLNRGVQIIFIAININTQTNIHISAAVLDQGMNVGNAQLIVI